MKIRCRQVEYEGGDLEYIFEYRVLFWWIQLDISHVFQNSYEKDDKKWHHNFNWEPFRLKWHINLNQDLYTPKPKRIIAWLNEYKDREIGFDEVNKRIVYLYKVRDPENRMIYNYYGSPDYFEAQEIYKEYLKSKLKCPPIKKTTIISWNKLDGCIHEEMI